MSLVKIREGTSCRGQDKIDEQEKFVEIIIAFRNLHDKIQIPVDYQTQLVGCVSNQPA